MAFDGKFQTGADERRRAPRLGDDSPVYIGQGGLGQMCRLVDVSAGGARVALPAGWSPKTELVLVDPKTGACCVAQLVWRTGRQAGLRFIRRALPSHD